MCKSGYVDLLLWLVWLEEYICKAAVRQINAYEQNKIKKKGSAIEKEDTKGDFCR